MINHYDARTAVQEAVASLITVYGFHATFLRNEAIRMLATTKISSIPWKSLLLAPLAVVPVIVLSGLGTSDAGVGEDFFWGVFVGVLFGAPAAFLGMVVIGLPSYFLLRRFGLLRLWTVCTIGFMVPLLLLLFDELRFAETLVVAVSGTAVAGTAYLLLPK